MWDEKSTKRMRKIGANRSGNNTKLISYYSPDYSVFRKPEPEPQLFGENIYFRS